MKHITETHHAYVRASAPKLQAMASKVARVHCAKDSRVVEDDHAEAGEALRKLRELADEYVPPGWACGTVKALLRGLEEFEADMHRQENYILFPRMVES